MTTRKRRKLVPVFTGDGLPTTSDPSAPHVAGFEWRADGTSSEVKPRSGPMTMVGDGVPLGGVAAFVFFPDDAP